MHLAPGTWKEIMNKKEEKNSSAVQIVLSLPMSLRVHILSCSVFVRLVRITQEVVLNHCGAFTTISLPLRISTGWPFGLELAEQIQAVFAENRIL